MADYCHSPPCPHGQSQPIRRRMLALTPINNPLTASTTLLGAGPGELYARFVFLLSAYAGGLFLIGIIYGGLLWMTSGGEEEKITKGKTIILWCGIGIVVIFSAYLITNFFTGAVNHRGLIKSQ